MLDTSRYRRPSRQHIVDDDDLRMRNLRTTFKCAIEILEPFVVRQLRLVRRMPRAHDEIIGELCIATDRLKPLGEYRSKRPNGVEASAFEAIGVRRHGDQKCMFCNEWLDFLNAIRHQSH